MQALQPKHAKESRTHFRPARIGKPSDLGANAGALHDANPLRLQNGGRRQAVFGTELYLPRQATSLRRQRNHGDLCERRKEIGGSDNQHGPSLVWMAEAKPTDVPARNHGNAGSPSSEIGPCSPSFAHAAHAACCASGVRTSPDSSASTVTTTRFPSSFRSSSSSMVRPRTVPRSALRAVPALLTSISVARIAAP
jgi:hypothetical protein